jgi:hypothetical protein
MSSHLFLYAVTKFRDEAGQDNSRWTRVGALFPNTKGGFRLKLELVPLDPTVDLVAMPPRERDDE